eukprot:m.23715 g.23715  ORF g.23715 m.23715 type:complete len:316 (-) comp14320_c0_seq1:280-1227(-)
MKMARVYAVSLLALSFCVSATSIRVRTRINADSNNATGRQALFWLEPYTNLTSVADYKQAWRQWEHNKRDGYIMAGSAYAAKINGSLGYADTAAGEGLEGLLMEEYGFPALKSMGLRTIAMVYVTHFAAIKIIVANPQPFIAQLLAKAKAVGLDGFDIDYEPQGVAHRPDLVELDAGFMQVLTLLATAMAKENLILTIDTGACPKFFDFTCSAASQLVGLNQVNTMSVFNVRSLDDFKGQETMNLPTLGSKWAPGFEPGNLKANQGQVFKDILTYAATTNVRTIATWEVHECNVGDQPQWLFDVVNAFLDAPESA